MGMLDDRILSINNELNKTNQIKREATEQLDQAKKLNTESFKEMENLLENAHVQINAMEKETQQEIETTLRLRQQFALESNARITQLITNELFNDLKLVSFSVTRKLIRKNLSHKDHIIINDDSLLKLEAYLRSESLS